MLTAFSRYKVQCRYVGGDFTKEAEIEKMCDDILKLYPDGIDILMNNAGTVFITLYRANVLTCSLVPEVYSVNTLVPEEMTASYVNGMPEVQGVCV